MGVEPRVHRLSHEVRRCSSAPPIRCLYVRSALASSVTIAVRPADYQTPSFPSLYLPVPVNGPQSRYLYDAGDIWRYTFYWTLICYAAIHLASASYAVLLQLRNLKVIWIVPIIWAVVGGTEAVIAGSITGGL